MFNKDRIVRFVGLRRYKPLTAEELAGCLSVDAAEYDQFTEALDELQIEGRIVKTLEKRWVDPQRARMMVGRLRCNPEGFGFVIPVVEGEDVYVGRDDMDGAMHEDIVVVEYFRPSRQRGRRHGKLKLGPAGRVVRVLKRSHEQLIGTYTPGKKFGRVLPDEPCILRDVYIPHGKESGAAENEKVLVKITAWPDPSVADGNPGGEVLRVLGREGAAEIDVQSVICQFNLSQEFSSRALKEAGNIPKQPLPDDKYKRRDLRRFTTITIDPVDARDHDDALSLYHDARTGNWVVMVHISDVSRYIHPESALDLEARERGQSVYLISDFVPMLPKEATQRTLSLVEGEDRLTKTVILDFDDDAELVHSSICHSVINVDKAMTYPAVKALLDAAGDIAEARATAMWSHELVDMLIGLDRLAQQLRARRRTVGSVDLDVPDYDVRVDDQGRVIAVTQIERDRSHDLVEEFMLSANRVVAEFLRANELPAMYRTHEEPDKEDLLEFADFILAITGKTIDPLDRRQLQELLVEVSDSYLSEAINMELLRCMKRARYEAQHRPHFALRFETYCHFTSPVRRYPDLVVHQILDQYFAGKLASEQVRHRWHAKLPAIAAACSRSEQRADEAEREIVKLKMLRFLQDHLEARTATLDAVITGVKDYGIFAQLQGYPLDGLIKIQQLRDDSYRFDARQRALVGTRKGRTLRLGQPIKVAIDRIDMTRRQMDLVLKD